MLNLAGILIGSISISIILFSIVNHSSFTTKMNYIKHYKIPTLVKKKFLLDYKLMSYEMDEVEKALKQYFALYLLAVYKKVPSDNFLMPSKIVDDLWHEFILDTKSYSLFCHKAFGKMLHHNPSGSELVGDEKVALKNTYQASILLREYDLLYIKEGMPLIFKIDEKYAKGKGHHYEKELEKMMSKPKKTQHSSYQTSSPKNSQNFVSENTSYGTQNRRYDDTNDSSDLFTTMLIMDSVSHRNDNDIYVSSPSCSSSSDSSSSSSCSSSSSSCSSSSSSSCSSSSSSSCSSGSSSSCSSGGSD